MQLSRTTIRCSRARAGAPIDRAVMTPIRDIYDALPPERGAALRRANLERLAELEADGPERRARMVAAAEAPTRPAGPAT